MPIPGRKYIVVQYEKDRVVEQPDETKLKSTVKQSEKDRLVTQTEKDRVVTQTEKDRVVEITDGEEIASITEEGYQDVSIHGSHDGDSISFEQDDIAATTGYVLIDLSDIINYPHDNINRLGIDWIIATGLADVNAVGYYDIGFITRINGTNSDWYSIFHDHFDKKEQRFKTMLNLIPQSVECNPTKHLSGGGMKLINDTTFNTGGTVKGTYSDTTTPAVGDLVLKVTRSAGQADLAVAVGYHSH